jgi:hypothetical protein
MAYIINRFDGTQLTIVDDGVLDNSTPLSLVGRNYTGYGEAQNENFIFLLENFANPSPPTRPLTGQAWYDKNAKALKVYNGTAWLSIGNATVNETEPGHSNGGLWLKTTTQQLYISDGAVWRLVGPEAAEGFAVTKMTSKTVKASTGLFFPIIVTELNGVTTSIQSDQEFTLDNTANEISGFSTIYPGLNYPTAKYAVTGNLRGNATSATRLETARTINGVSFNGTDNITVKAITPNALLPGEYINGTSFDGGVEDTWNIDATPQSRAGSIVARDSTGGFSATQVIANVFGDVVGNITSLSGASIINTLQADTITGRTFSGNSATATRLQVPPKINTIEFDGTKNITLPVPADTLTTDTLAPNVVNSSLVNLGKLEFLEVEAPGIKIGDGNNINIYIEGFTPTIESDVTNALKLKLATGNARLAPTTITFVSSLTAASNGGTAPSLVPDFTLSTTEDQRPALGLPSYRWSNLYSKKVTTDTVQTTTLTGNGPTNQVTVSNNLIVTGATYSTVYGNVTGNVIGNVTGAASLNMLKAGDVMTGDLAWFTTGRGLTWSMNSDGASIKFYNTGDADTNSRLEFNTNDNGNEYFRWTHTISNNTFESMRLTPNTFGSASLILTGDFNASGNISLTGTFQGNGSGITNINAFNLATGTVPSARLSGGYAIDVTGNLTGNVTGDTRGTHTGAVIGDVTGTASGNLSATGGTLTGNLNWVTTGRGITWGMNTDGASIKFYNTGDGDASSRLEFQTTDNGNEYFSWTHASGSTFESMRLVPNSSGNAALTVFGNATINGTTTGTFLGNGTSLDINADRLTTGTVPSGRLSGTYNISISGNANTATSAGTATNQAGGSINATTGSFSGRVAQSVSGFHAASKEVISTRTDSGFYDWPNPTTANGWPVTGSWHHLLSSTHVNDANYYAMQFSADFYAQNLYYRSTGGSGATAWNKILHSTNFNDYAPTKAGVGATGTWNIAISGNANTVTTLNSGQIVSALGFTPISAGALTNQSGTAIYGTTATFSGQVNVSVAGIKFPNDPYGGSGDTASITYESVSGEKTRLRFRVANDGGISPVDDKAEFLLPDNDSLLVNGYVTLNAANYNSYSPTLSGGNASGTWNINVLGNAGSASSVAWNGVTGKPDIILNDGNTYGINISGNSNTASSTTVVSNRGNVTAESNGTGEPGSALTLRSVYNNGYPTQYGNAITLGGAGGGELLVGWSGSTGGHADNYIRSRRDTGNVWSAWAKLITDVNYNQYAPTLTGGNASGTWGINITGNAVTVSAITSTQVTNALGYIPVNPSTLTNTAGTTANFSSGQFTGDVTLAKYEPTLFFNHIGDSGIELAISVNAAEGLVIYEPEDGSEWFRIDDNSNAGYLWSSQILTANNYNTYAPTKTGTGASGTWPISISGNAVTVTSVTYQQVINALGYAPANASDLARVTTSPLQASNITTTGTLTVAQGADLGIRWPNDAYGGGGDTARITLESAGGEAIRMRFTMTNDADDQFEFSAPSYNGLTMNGYPVHHDGNAVFTSGTNYSTSGFTNQVGSWNFGANHFDVYPPGGYTMAHLAAFIPSIHVIQFAGGVNGDDSMVCYWENLGDRIRVYVQNTEQRSTPAANWLAIWRR